MKRSAFLLVSLSVLLAASTVHASGQTYLNQVGNPSFGVNIPVENGFIDLSNGNLHLEFPLATHPQRGALNLNERLVYDSRIWTIIAYSNHYWWPLNIPNVPLVQAGWRFVTGAETGTITPNTISTSTSDCPSSPDQPLPAPGSGDGGNGGTDSSSVSTMTWTDPSGTSHTFNAYLTEYDNNCPGDPPSSRTISGGPATDGSGYQVKDDGSGNPVVVDSGGTQVYPQVIDRYGNFWSFDSNGDLIDDTGRVPVIVTKNANGNPNVTWYDVLAPNGPIQNNGSRVRYVVTTAPILVRTQFNEPAVTEWPNDGSVGTLTPVQSIQLPDGSSYTFGYDHNVSLSDQTPHYGDLVSVTLPGGGLVRYGYTSFFDSYQNVNHWLYSRTVGTNPSMTFTPSVLTQCASNGTGCQEQVVLHKPSGDETVYQLTLNNGAWNTNTTVYTGAVSSGHGIVQTTNTFDFSHPCNTQICTGSEYIQKSVSTTKFLDTGAQSQSQAIYNDPTTGKVSALKEWDYGTDFTKTPTRETDYSYIGFDTQQITVMNMYGNPAGQTTYGYTTGATATSSVAQHGTQNAGGPYLQTVSHLLVGGSPTITTYGMDDTGQVVNTRDPIRSVNTNQPPTSTMVYQCANSLPAQMANGLGQVTRYGFDCNSGAVTSIQDPNDFVAGRPGTLYTYESAAGRPQDVNYPDGGQTAYTYPSTTEIDTTVLASPNPSVVSQNILDAFGRKYQNVVAGTSSETTYDVNGRVGCVTNPHPVGQLVVAGTSTCMTAYDGLDRPLTQQQPDGSALGWNYSGATTTSTDETGKQWQRTIDSFGHLTKVIEPGNYTTTYAYDALGNLASIVQGGVFGTDAPRIRTFMRDSLSRLTNECHPEGIAGGHTCAISGPWSTSYSYDGNGNVQTVTDARGVVATLGYDNLNRLLSKTYTNDPSGTASSCYQYDISSIPGASGNLIGRLTNSWTQPGACPSSPVANVLARRSILAYDAMGRLLSDQQCTRGTCGSTQSYTPSYTYDLAGNLVNHGDGRGVLSFQNSYDAAGRLLSVVQPTTVSLHPGASTSGVQAITNRLFTATSFSPTGALSGASFGSGLQMSRTYDNRLRVINETDTGVVVPNALPGSATITIPGLEQTRP